mgnify:CR=1 FL=1
MKFVLMPDSLSAAWFRGLLATQGSVGVKVGTFTGLLDTLKSLWLLADIEDVFDQAFKTAVIESNNSFWSKSIKVDEPSTLSELEASLKYILSVLPLNTSLDKISNPKSRIDGYFNDFVALHTLMGEVRPVDQMLAMQWLSQSNSDSIESLQLIYLPEFFAFDTWQIEVLERLSSHTPENAADEQVLQLLVDGLEVNATKESDIQQLAQTLYKSPCISQEICPENIRWLACRDSLQECEVLVGMVQSALKQGVSIDEMAIVLPQNSEQLRILPALLNKSGILTSNIHQSRTVFEWDVQLLKDLLVYFSFKKELKDAASPMSLATVLTNPLMPWSLNRGQRYADVHFRGALKEKVDDKSNDDSDNNLLQLLLEPGLEDWNNWLVEIISRLKFPSDARLFSKAKLLDLVESLSESILLYQDQSELAQISSLINLLKPKHILIDGEISGLVKNGLLLLTESEWLFQPKKHLFMLGFNQGSYTSRDRSMGVFSSEDCKVLSENTAYSFDTTADPQRCFETRLKRLVSQPDSSITILLAQQSFDGEKLYPSESLLDMALCFQSSKEVEPEQLIQSILAMDNPTPFFNECQVVIKSAQVVLAPKDLLLCMDLFEINKDKEGKSRAESPSSLEKMMISPLAWLLGRQGLEPKGWDVQSLGVALKGTIAHKVFELHFDSEREISYGQGNSDYDVLYQTALEEDAAFLLQPQWRLERTQLKYEIKEALGPFLDWCETDGWSIHSTEQRLAGELWSLPLKGFVDVVLETEQKTLILDYKKSKSKDRITRLNSGYDLQTLIYRELFNQQEGGNPVSIHSGYYTLNDQTLVLDVFASSSVKGITKAQLAVDLDGQSEKAVIKIKERIKQLREGEVLLNQEDDTEFWKGFGIKAEYSIDSNPLVGHFMKAAEEQGND